jgi:hypothetical protein
MPIPSHLARRRLMLILRDSTFFHALNYFGLCGIMKIMERKKEEEEEFVREIAN